MDEQVISVAYGKETFATNSISLSSFIVTAPFARSLPSKTFKRHGACQSFPASAYPEVNGTLYLDTVRVPDGTIVLLQASHKQFARPLSDGAIFLRTRHTGPMLVVHATLPTAEEAMNTGSFLMFQGRADILTADEVEEDEACIEVPTHWRRAFLSEEEVEECFKVSSLSPELASRVRTQVMQVGDEKIVVTARRVRRFKARR